MNINTSGSGNIVLNSLNGSVYTNSDSLIISGFVKNSIYRTSSKDGGYSPSTPWNIPLTNDTILFDFQNTSIAGTYWANIGVGVDGQKLNIIYNNKSSNIISVLANFNGMLLGSVSSNGIVLNTTGQNSTLVYLGDDIDSWQLLNNNISGSF